MRTALDAPSSGLDADERSFVAALREYGWFRTTVMADEDGPGFSYTTGFWLSAGFPEIILFALGDDTAHAILSDLFNDMQAGTTPVVGTPAPGILGNNEAALIPVDPAHYQEYLGWSLWFYGGNDFPCLQLVWPDPEGRFPWQPGFEERFVGLQPDLSGHWGKPS